MDMTPGIIDLNIDELVIDGAGSAPTEHIRRAVERELTRRFTGAAGLPGTPAGVIRIGRLDLPSEPGSNAEQIGRHVAHGVHGGIPGSGAGQSGNGGET